MTVLRTACPLDCPDTCSLEVEVDGGRLVRVDAGAGNPLTAGYICQKVKHHPRRVHGPDRVLTPLVRRGSKGSGQFEPVWWDVALDLVAERIRQAVAETGAGSVVPYLYNSSAGVLAAAGLSVRLFSDLRAARVEHTICAATAGAAWTLVFGDMLSAEPADVSASRLVIVWGANPTVSNIHFPPLVREAQGRGARVVVVDPRRTAMARRADLHLALRPGTDVVAALAVARHLADTDRLDRDFLADHAAGVDEFLTAAAPWTLERAGDVCGVEPADLAMLAGDLASIRPALLRIGWGLERNRNGGSAYRAVLALMVLTGQFGQPGAGIIASLSDAAPLRIDHSRAAEPGTPPPASRRRLNMNSLGADLSDATLDPPVRVLFVQGANPAVMNPNQRLVLRGLARDDLFTVVHDQVMTDTGRWADVVLPATTHFESDDLAVSYGSYVLQRVPPVIDRVGESRTNDEVAAGLAVRLGLDPARFDPDPAAQIAAAVADGGGATGARVLREPGTTVQFRDTWPTTATRRAQLVHPVLGELRVPRYEPLDSPFPLTLISPATHRTINSMFGEFNGAAAEIGLHPADAATRAIADGDQVRVWNDLGEIVIPARVDADLCPGVVSIPKGLWGRELPGGLTANALTPDTLNDLAGGACFNDARVDVARMPL